MDAHDDRRTVDDLGDGRTAGFPSTAQYAFLIIGPLLIMALLVVGLPTVRWVSRFRVLGEACTVSPAVLFMGYTLAVSVIQRSSDVVRGNLVLVLTIGLIDLVAVTVCALVLVESRTTPRLLMTLSFFLLLVGDVLFGVDYWTEPVISQRFFLLPWLGSALFFALAALHARPATVRMRTVRPLVRSMVVYTPVLIAYLIGFYQLVWGGSSLSTLEAARLVITGILASGNHVAIFVENARLTQSLRTNLERWRRANGASAWSSTSWPRGWRRRGRRDHPQHQRPHHQPVGRRRARLVGRSASGSPTPRTSPASATCSPPPSGGDR